jgi:hypothetical protein
MDTVNIAESFTDVNTGVAQQVYLSEITTRDVAIAAALNAIPQWTPLSWDDTANAYKLWAVGEKIAAVTAYAIPDSASIQRAAVVTHGVFNVDALNWPATTTEAQVQDGQSGNSLQFRKLLSSDKRISVDGSNLVGPAYVAPVTG